MSANYVFADAGSSDCFFFVLACAVGLFAAADLEGSRVIGFVVDQSISTLFLFCIEISFLLPVFLRAKRSSFEVDWDMAV